MTCSNNSEGKKKKTQQTEAPGIEKMWAIRRYATKAGRIKPGMSVSRIPLDGLKAAKAPDVENSYSNSEDPVPLPPRHNPAPQYMGAWYQKASDILWKGTLVVCGVISTYLVLILATNTYGRVQRRREFQRKLAAGEIEEPEPPKDKIRHGF